MEVEAEEVLAAFVSASVVVVVVVVVDSVIWLVVIACGGHWQAVAAALSVKKTASTSNKSQTPRTLNSDVDFP